MTTQTIALFVIFGLFFAGGVNAGAEHNVSGYAWSENIGWISFNSINCDTDQNGFIDSGDCDGDNATISVINYGVNIDQTTGKFSGYAWSENIGWISFERSDTGVPPLDDPCPDGACTAKIDNVGNLGISDVNIIGWAKVLAHDGGWDGWIRFDHGKENEVSISSNGDFYGWAWSDMVVGWISFNSSDTDSTILYKGEFQHFNQPPSANNLSVIQLNYCDVFSPTAILSWSFADPDIGFGDTQSAYQIQVDNNSDFSSLEIDTGKVLSSSNSRTTSSGDLDYNATYYWRLKVWDSFDAFSFDWIYPPSPIGFPTIKPGTPFSAPVHAYPYPDFTHSPANPPVGATVNFTDNSKCYSAPSNTEYDCKNGGAIQYAWDFDYIVTEGFTEDSNVKGNVTTSFDGAKDSYDVRLKIIDNSFSPSKFCVRGGDGPVKIKSIRLPKWKEVSP